jgi:hypothetical protein
MLTLPKARTQKDTASGWIARGYVRSEEECMEWKGTHYYKAVHFRVCIVLEFFLPTKFLHIN